jgi:hypothetical protein
MAWLTARYSDGRGRISRYLYRLRKEIRVNTLIIIRVMAIALAGMYAMRTAHAPMEGRIAPLTFLALAVLVFCVFIFHRAPMGTGWWAYTVLAGSVIGCGVNVMFMRMGPVGTVDYVISVVSVLCWAIIAFLVALNVLNAFSSSGT